MRKFDSPYIADWFAISLRWLTLFALTVTVSKGSELISLLPLIILALWNLSMSVMAGLNFRLNYHRQLSIFVDLVFASILFWTQGGLTGAVLWVAFLPILSGAIYFEILGSMLSAGIMAAITIAYSNFKMPTGSLMAGGIGAAVTLALGVLFGFLSHRLINSLRRLRENQEQKEKKRQRVENERLRAIYDLTTTLNATLSYKRVLESALDLSVRAMHPDADEDFSDQLVSAVLLFVGNKLIVKSARRYTSADQRLIFSGTEGVLGTAITEGESVLTQNVGYDPELSRVIALRSCTSSYCVPLRTGFTVYGVLLFSHPDPEYFTVERREMLELIGRQSVIAIQNARLYQDLIEEKERMIEVQEEARKKLARDLHDGPTQSISAIAMRLNLIRMMLTRAPEKVEGELINAEDLARRTTKEIRHMLFTLRPLVLESQGLCAALEAMAEKMNETFGQNVQINVDDKLIENLEMGKQGVIFFLAEEAVNNARKHAKASLIDVRLRYLDHGLIVLEIKDNGKGFDVKAVTKNYEKRGSLGMVNLDERTELINGLLHIDSAPDKGTNVQVFIPLTEEAADRLHRAK
ncbi:MAG: GAF domain-containing sensor histidine kinase [Anaerolineae bacterium]|jgi:signal transduction histidine kinase|nr:GAF domain-containing sensor histidine kinase [Anaerolineae bacterium]MBT3711983.1 GAF domain-containing sensor histidine kinase [Anaerolineae bacterium]MBT4310442.1 GAF domain-containing sensor histidine kinase [Anaerolineae bacterium]MBT4458778.1 GAF domain-containing sensor histidine kinase [Anaerolineae bacterium]MBT4842212.1 GAF domain-containing sensor histidine kinase [Anaerolineae bacterium]